jgi:Cys-tRNA(Pro)/Cys-tRNA(Cys) deacylase
MSGRGTPAIDALRAAGVPYVSHEYAHDPAAVSGDRRTTERTGYGLEAAAALGVEPGRVFKTLVASLDGRRVLGVVPVTGELDLGALATALAGKRATMAERSAAERATGYVIGGINPLGGRRGLDVELSPADLVALTGARVAPIARR